MQINISARQFEISDNTRNHVKKDMQALLEKVAERPTSASITFNREANQSHCEITVHLSTGLTAHAKSKAYDVLPAFDQCSDKLAKQLRRYKRKLKNHHNERTTPVEYSTAVSSVLASSPQEDSTDEQENLKPVIIAEMEARIPMLTVGEAVFQMELAESKMLLFRNQSHGRVNIVHMRDDGNIGWIDPDP